MTQLISPAPFASTTPGLAFGATSPKPYSPYRPHGGKDYKWSVMRPLKSKRVVAPISGVVEVAHNDGGDHDGWGNYVLIRVNDRVKVRLAHHATGTVKVKAGARLDPEDPIGTMGDTGETNGVHLHEELLIDGVRVDPDLYRAPHGRHLPGTPIPSATTGKKPGKVYVVTTSTHLRNAPKTGRRTRIKPLAVGQRLRVLKVTGQWATILRHTGVIVYVWAARLTPEKLTTTQRTPLRAAASATGRLIRKLTEGTRLTVIGPSRNRRVRVRTKDGLEGWAYRKHLK